MRSEVDEKRKVGKGKVGVLRRKRVGAAGS